MYMNTVSTATTRISQQVFCAADLGQPAGLGALIDDADLPAPLGTSHTMMKVGCQLGGDIVHHQGEQRLIGVPFGLEEGGRKPQMSAGQQCRRPEMTSDQHEFGDLVSQQIMQAARSQTANEDLTLGADVPEAHLEGGRHRQRNAQQDRQVLEGDPGPSGGVPKAPLKIALQNIDRDFRRSAPW